nr:hypothetical protein [Tanacetum cinerariifolium]
LIHYITQQQKTLYKALIDAYGTEKVIHDTYGDTVTFKRRHDDDDNDEEPFTRSNRGSKRRRARKEPESSSAPKEKTFESTEKSKEGSKSHQKSTGKSAQVDELIYAAEDLEEPTPQEFNTGFTDDQPVKEASQLPDWFRKQLGLQIPIVFGTRLCLLLMDQFNHGLAIWLRKNILGFV